MDLTIQGFCSIAFYAWDFTSITRNIHNWILFFISLPLLFLSRVIFPLISSGIFGTSLPGKFIFQCHIFLPFHTVHGILEARTLKWFVIPFSSYHVLPELSIMIHSSWVALHSIAHGFINVRQDCDPCDQFGAFAMIVVFILSALWFMRIRGLWKLPGGRDWLWGKLGLALVGMAMHSRSLIQLSADGWGCVSS